MTTNVPSSNHQNGLLLVRNKFREMNNDIYSVIMSFMDVMNSSSFYSFLYQKYNDQSDELLKFIFPALYNLSSNSSSSDQSTTNNTTIKVNSELTEITFILHCLGLVNQLKSAVTFNSLPPLEVFPNIDLYKECDNFVSLLELIKTEYIYYKKVDRLKLFKFVMNLDCLARYIGYGLSHFNLKTKSLKDSYFTTFSALPFLKKVKETLLEKFEPIQLFEKYHIPITSRAMKEILNQMTFRSNKYISSFYYSTYGYSLCMDIIRVTEHEIMEEDFVNTLSYSFKLNFLKDLHIWADFRKIKNEKLFFDQLLKLIANLNNNLNLLYIDIDYYENEDQLVKLMELLNSVKKNLHHLTISTYTESKDMDPFVKISKLDFTHNIKHLTLIDKNNFNLLNRLIFKNASSSENSKLEQLTISNIDYLYMFLNTHTSLKRLDFYGNLNSTNESFNDTNLIKESFMNLKSLDTVFIDDRNEALGYSVLGNMGIYINNIIFKYSKNGYTLSSLIECFKRNARRVDKLTIIDNTNFGTNIQLLCKIVSSFLFDNILNQLVIHTRHVSLLNELTFSIHHMFSPTELELKYLQIIKKLNSIDFILFIGKANNPNNNFTNSNLNVTITIVHSIPISGEFNIKDEIIDKRAEIESVMSNVCILGSSVQLDQVDIHTFRPPFNHYLFYRFLHSLSFSNNLTLTRSSLYQLMIVK